jgi:hypothetical protein
MRKKPKSIFTCSSCMSREPLRTAQDLNFIRRRSFGHQATPVFLNGRFGRKRPFF